jgi:hypothetical protein
VANLQKKDPTVREHNSANTDMPLVEDLTAFSQTVLASKTGKPAFSR